MKRTKAERRLAAWISGMLIVTVIGITLIGQLHYGIDLIVQLFEFLFPTPEPEFVVIGVEG